MLSATMTAPPDSWIQTVAVMNTIKIYNSLTGDKETFVPLEEGKVRMYVCGMTVYDYCHLGHARVRVVFLGVLACVEATDR